MKQIERFDKFSTTKSARHSKSVAERFEKEGIKKNIEAISKIFCSGYCICPSRGVNVSEPCTIFPSIKCKSKTNAEMKEFAKQQIARIL